MPISLWPLSDGGPPTVKFFLLPQTLAASAGVLVSGALLIWSYASKPGGARGVSPAETTQLINNSNAIIIDVRDSTEFARGSVTGARNIPAAELSTRVNDLARFKNRPVVLVCNSGASSARSLGVLSTAGFTEVYNLAGGINAWREAGMPVVKAAVKDNSGALKKEKT
jgi:rhodanese-related sulfurtransferase